jgi:hypothetical protein
MKGGSSRAIVLGILAMGFFMARPAAGKTPGSVSGDRSGPVLGLRLEAILFQLARGPGVLPAGELELAYVPKILKGRIRVGVSWGGGGVIFSGEGEDRRLESEKGTRRVGYHGTLTLQAVVMSLDVSLRLFNLSARLSPYLAYRPRVFLLRTIMETSIAGVEAGRVVEWSWYLTAEGALGLEVRAGPGRFLSEVSVGWFPLHHESTGNVASLSIGILLGYRYQF